METVCFLKRTRPICIDRPNWWYAPKAILKYGIFFFCFVLMTNIKQDNPHIYRHNEFGWYLDVWYFLFAA